MSTTKPLLPEIQGLRAVAVGLVVLFHVWPGLVGGGYVGVDVFFVISGYLITGLLARAAIRDGRISLLDFYSRRARRLLPAATAVLMCTAVGTLILIPPARWEETAQQIAASALYVQNWLLAWLSVDYLGAEQAPSPVQHYWSLSIEEQFYVVWPLMMIAATAIARRNVVSVRRAFIIALGVIFVLSLAASLWITAREPERAYFVTHTRIWELALGGLLALAIHRFKAGPASRAILTAIGLAAIAVSALTFTVETAFPGYAALLPTVGAALVITAGDVRLGVFRGLNHAVLRYLGDRSYSIYLWHWPIVTFYAVRDDSLGYFDGPAIILLTLVISHLSYRYIEEPFRHPRGRGELRPLAYGLASIAACVIASGSIQYTVNAQASAAAAHQAELYPGGMSLYANVPVPEVDAPVPALTMLKDDLPAAYEEKCHVPAKSADLNPCFLGDRNGDLHVVLVGDSHAANWIPALDQAGAERGWRIDSHTKSGCALVKVDLNLRGRPYKACTEWGRKLHTLLLHQRPDVLLFTMSAGQDLFPPENERPGDMTAAVVDNWRDFLAVGIRVVAIKDTPRMPFRPENCSPPSGCVADEEDVFPHVDRLRGAAKEAEVPLLDMTDLFCRAGTCPLVIGNVIAWRDQAHMTATYSRTLSDALGDRLEEALTSADRPS